MADGPLPFGDAVALAIVGYVAVTNPQAIRNAWNSLTGANSGPYTVLSDNNNNPSNAAPEAGAAATPSPMGPPEDPNKKKQEEFIKEAICDAAGSPVCPSVTPTTQWNNGRQYLATRALFSPQKNSDPRLNN